MDLLDDAVVVAALLADLLGEAGLDLGLQVRHALEHVAQDDDAADGAELAGVSGAGGAG